MIVVYVFMALVLLRVLLIGVGAALLIRPVLHCPACFHDTLKLRRPVLALGNWIEWRWCPSCGWQGLARVTVPAEKIPDQVREQGRKHVP